LHSPRKPRRLPSFRPPAENFVSLSTFIEPEN
jgi:hypothetical protein